MINDITEWWHHNSHFSSPIADSLRYQSITIQPEYRHLSFEELRFASKGKHQRSKKEPKKEGEDLNQAHYLILELFLSSELFRNDVIKLVRQYIHVHVVLVLFMYSVHYMDLCTDAYVIYMYSICTVYCVHVHILLLFCILCCTHAQLWIMNNNNHVLKLMQSIHSLLIVSIITLYMYIYHWVQLLYIFVYNV